MDNTANADALTDRQRDLLKDLSSWVSLQPIVTTLNDEEEIKWLMRAESKGQNRLRVLTRLYSRLGVVRKERELRQLSEGIIPFGG